MGVKVLLRAALLLSALLAFAGGSTVFRLLLPPANATHCVSSACEKHAAGQGDPDCCAPPEDGLCASGYDYTPGVFGCGQQDPPLGAVTTCCVQSMGWLVDGCPKNRNSGEFPLPTLADANDRARVVCCTGEFQATRKYTNEIGTEICLDGRSNKNFAEARQICQDRGWRLCRVAELNTPTAAGSCNGGCGLDDFLVWADFDHRPPNPTRWLVDGCPKPDFTPEYQAQVFAV